MTLTLVNTFYKGFMMPSDDNIYTFPVKKQEEGEEGVRAFEVHDPERECIPTLFGYSPEQEAFFLVQGYDEEELDEDAHTVLLTRQQLAFMAGYAQTHFLFEDNNDNEPTLN